jgi:deoxyribodipyrimidine photo-lyase
MRRALRVQDNTPLWNAVQDAAEVLPVVCLSDDASYRVDSPRRRFIAQSLFNLDGALLRAGSNLGVLVGSPLQEIPAAAGRLGVEAVYATAVYDPKTISRDERIRKELSAQRIVWTTFKDVVVFEGLEVLSAAGQPFKVFTPYKKAWLATLDKTPKVLPALRKVPTPSRIPGPTLSTLLKNLPPAFEPGGEEAAGRRLKAFVARGIGKYRVQRDLLGIGGTSKLSSHLAHGTISIRKVLAAALDAGKSAEREEWESIDTFIGELVWREFYYQILANFPHIANGSFKEKFDALVWSENKDQFSSWCEGRTGYPVVDAAMRQLAAEGWMHNRARMIVASFLTKDLHINWQWGEKYFFSRLVDADIASNNGGWQWTAGTGTDASPWFRIFNPVVQGEKFDAGGTYVRTYVPELHALPNALIHKPWTMTGAEQAQYGVWLGKTYPRPMVNHAHEREVTLHLYKHPGTGHRQLS